MIDVSNISPLLLALIGLSIGTIAAELFATPRLRTPGEAIRRVLWASIPIGLVYAACIGVSARPILSLIFTLVLAFTITVISNVKARVLREPLVYTDIALLGQVFLYPRLYIDYIGWGPVLALIVALPGAIGFGFWLEAPLWAQSSFVDLWPGVLALGVVFYLAWTFIRAQSPRLLLLPTLALSASTDIRIDFSRFGLFWTLLLYAVLSGNKRPSSVQPPSDLATPPSSTLQPHLIAIQCESFFDARRLHSEIDPALLQHFDACVAKSEVHGRLQVPAWGANTMRTEFSFLTGIASETLGVHRYNPFLHLAKSPVDSMAWKLKAQGYRTVCIHPYHATFFERHVVYPALGFDDFLHIDDFVDAPTFGPYITDLAISMKVKDLINATEQPLFIFAITMENHGQWEQDRFASSPEVEAELPQMATLHDRELSMYLRHLGNADAMVGDIMTHMSTKAAPPSVFCMFGDHQPSFPGLFGQLELEDECTDYVIWTGRDTASRRQDVSAEELMPTLLDLVS